MELASIIKSWNEKSAATKSVLVRASGERFIPAGGYTASSRDGSTLPAEDLNFLEEFTLSIDFDNQWARLDSSRASLQFEESEFVVTQGSLAFNGADMRRLTPREKNEHLQEIKFPKYPYELQILEPKAAALFFEPLHYPVFFMTGNIPRHDKSITPLAPKIPATESDFSVSGRGVLNGQEHVVLRSVSSQNPRSYSEYWVDLSRANAIAQWIVFGGDTRRKQIQVLEWAEMEAHWVPKAYRLDSFRNGGLHESVSLRIDAIEFNNSRGLEHYTLTEEPGMYVANHMTDERYSPTASGKKIPMSQLAREGQASSNLGRVVAIVSVCVVLSLVAWWRFKSQAAIH